MNPVPKRILILTGNPGVGKTTVLIKTVDALKAYGFHVGGMISRETREGDLRVGFEIIDLTNSKRGWLAHANQKTGPRVGKYHVNIEDLNGVGTRAIAEAVENCDVIVIDEIGPMELFSEKFREAVGKALESSKLVIAIVHWKSHDRLISEVKNMEDAEIFVVDYGNREKLPGLIVKKGFAFLKSEVDK